MTHREHTSVLIVGAGPTGLMLAIQLARRGVNPVIIDRNPGPSVQSKALGVQARTLEFYHPLGLAEPAIEMGRIAHGAVMWASGRRRAIVPLGEIGPGLSPYPYMLILGQDANERLLGDKLTSLGITIRWNTELVSLADEHDAITATVRAPDGATTTIHADWVAGCDGSRSTVRTLRAIDFPGAPYEHVFFVSDVTLTGGMAPDHINIYLWKGGFYLCFPMRGENHWRVVGILPEALRGIDNLTFDPVAQAVQREAGANLRFADCRWFGTYRVHHRCAERFRDGRCFLLGDAAHIHSPVGAQGMNTGLQDACNLAWKLALVVNDRATPALLDTYAPEREPFARRLLGTTDRAFSAIVAQGPGTSLFRTRVLPAAFSIAMRLPFARRLAFRTISQIGIRYPRSALSQSLDAMPRGAPRPGDRFPWLRLRFDDTPLAVEARSASDGAALAQGIPGPAGPNDLFHRLDDTRFNLLLFGQSVASLPDNFSDLIRAHVVTDNSTNRAALRAARIPIPSFFLLRPDGHIGLCGRICDHAALERYLRDRMSLTAPPTIAPLSSAPPARPRVLFLCTGNSCRSQMAEGFARALRADSIEAFSAGTSPHALNPLAVRAMREVGIDISAHISKRPEEIGITFDVVVTVCDSARESCPVLPGARTIHVGFDDPPRLARVAGATTDEQAMPHYRRVRDEIRAFIQTLPGSLTTNR